MGSKEGKKRDKRNSMQIWEGGKDEYKDGGSAHGGIQLSTATALKDRWS